ncbi:MAG: hypothetical protein LCH61_13220 [Proteobacteria bacterium]|nr:hypothetical protein [Pseudomonadota bacterium]
MKKPLACLLLLGLAACNQTAPAAPPEDKPVSRIGPAGFKLPDGAGCTGAVNKFRAQMEYDLNTGHTTKPVFEQVNKEIDAAAALCAAGNDGGARSAIAASRSRHGYPPG